MQWNMQSLVIQFLTEDMSFSVWCRWGGWSIADVTFKNPSTSSLFVAPATTQEADADMIMKDMQPPANKTPAEADARPGRAGFDVAKYHIL